MLRSRYAGYPSNAQPDAARSSFWMARDGLDYYWKANPLFVGKQPSPQRDRAFFPKALMWLLAHTAAFAWSGSKQS